MKGLGADSTSNSESEGPGSILVLGRLLSFTPVDSGLPPQQVLPYGAGKH